MKTQAMPFLIGFGFFLLSCSLGWSQQSIAQTTATTAVSSEQISAILQAYQKEQRALFSESLALSKRGATPQQMQVWYEQNSARFAAQQQRAQLMTIVNALEERPTGRKAVIPPDATPALKALLQTRVALDNARAALHNQIVQQATASGTASTLAQVSQLGAQETQLFQQQNSALLAQWKQEVQAVAAEVAKTEPAGSGQFAIPANLSPQMVDYLTIRNEMLAASQSVSSESPSVRRLAMETWQQQNATALARMNQDLQAISQRIPPPPRPRN